MEVNVLETETLEEKFKDLLGERRIFLKRFMTFLFGVDMST
jgi:hypothetical protein